MKKNKLNDIFCCYDTINYNSKQFGIFNLKKIKRKFQDKITALPVSYKILLENLLRNFDGKVIKKVDIENLINRKVGKEIQFKPSRVLMQDYTGVPAVADLAAMRDKVKEKKKDPKIINPSVPVSLVIDHSITVDSYGSKLSMNENVFNEFNRNQERYKLLKWAQLSFENFKVFPPGAGICHQINLEYISEVITKNQKEIFFDTVVGTDSHTTMVNALSILGWGVGGIEAESVMLGQSISMQIPEVLGVRLSGSLPEGVTATDLVLSITEKLRKYGVVGKLVEFFGSGLESLSLSERSTISNMAPEYGATCGIFPIDEETIKYLNLTGRKKELLSLIEKYSKIQGTWYSKTKNVIKYDNILEIELSSIESSLAGPRRPQDRVPLKNAKKAFIKTLSKDEKEFRKNKLKLNHGDVCLAAITSCTNTSNPSVLISAGIIAKKAMQLGIKISPSVKTSFAPGSQVVAEYLKEAQLLDPLESLGFNLVGFGCTTCIGNSGPLKTEIENTIIKNKLNVCSVISGNRNFEGRIHPLIKSNYLASPPLVILYAIAGTIIFDFYKEPIISKEGKNIYAKDLWPSNQEISLQTEKVFKKKIFMSKYKNIFEGDKNWKSIKVENSSTFNWSSSSTYIKKPPFLSMGKIKNEKINNAKPLMVLGDSVTTDHISPAGVIKQGSSAGNYLRNRQVLQKDFNSYGSRRGNHEIMVRGTFANVRIKNLIAKNEGGYSFYHPDNSESEVFEVAEKYSHDSTPLIVIAGKEYGTGSSRDWAAKGTKLLGVKIVVAESFERIHRSNLVGMGVLPLQLKNANVSKLKLTGEELFNFGDLDQYTNKPNTEGEFEIKYSSKNTIILKVISRIDTMNEIKYFRSDGILPYVLEEIC